MNDTDPLPAEEFLCVYEYDDGAVCGVKASLHPGKHPKFRHQFLSALDVQPFICPFCRLTFNEGTRAARAAERAKHVVIEHETTDDTAVEQLYQARRAGFGDIESLKRHVRGHPQESSDPSEPSMDSARIVGHLCVPPKTPGRVYELVFVPGGITFDEVSQFMPRLKGRNALLVVDHHCAAADWSLVYMDSVAGWVTKGSLSLSHFAILAREFGKVFFSISAADKKEWFKIVSGMKVRIEPVSMSEHTLMADHVLVQDGPVGDSPLPWLRGPTTEIPY